MNDTLICPICGWEMIYSDHMYLSHKHIQYSCNKGHERVMVKVEDFILPFVYLGDGCYVVLSDNTSCEKAIARMKREFYESPEYVTRVMEKSYQPDGHCGMIID